MGQRYLIENGNPVHTPAWKITGDGRLDSSVTFEGNAILATDGLRCHGTPKECGLDIETHYSSVVCEVP